MKVTIAGLQKILNEKQNQIDRLAGLFHEIKTLLWGEDSYRHEFYQIKEELEDRNFQMSADKMLLQEKVKSLTKENLRLWHIVRGKMGDKTLREEGLFKLNNYETWLYVDNVSIDSLDDVARRQQRPEGVVCWTYQSIILGLLHTGQTGLWLAPYDLDLNLYLYSKSL